MAQVQQTPALLFSATLRCDLTLGFLCALSVQWFWLWPGYAAHTARPKKQQALDMIQGPANWLTFPPASQFPQTFQRELLFKPKPSWQPLRN